MKKIMKTIDISQFLFEQNNPPYCLYILNQPLPHFDYFDILWKKGKLKGKKT